MDYGTFINGPVSINTNEKLTTNKQAYAKGTLTILQLAGGLAYERTTRPLRFLRLCNGTWRVLMPLVFFRYCCQGLPARR